MDVKDIDASKQAYVYFLSLYHNKCRHCLGFAVEVLLRTHVIVKRAKSGEQSIALKDLQM